jgi:hypothetical protein
MKCSVGTCIGTAQVREPLPLCGTCALRVIAAYAAANLGSEPQVQVRPRMGQEKVREFQDSVVVALFLNLNRRPQWTEIRDALIDANLPEVSRPTAQRIRERVEENHPELPTQQDN